MHVRSPGAGNGRVAGTRSASAPNAAAETANRDVTANLRRGAERLASTLEKTASIIGAGTPEIILHAPYECLRITSSGSGQQGAARWK